MDQKQKVRINKYLAKKGLGSRRQIDEWIEQARIEVNDQQAQLGDKIDPEEDTVKLDDKLVSDEPKEKLEYWLAYKPAGVVSTADDPYGRETVVNLIDSQARLYPVGRLDQESEGLILLTNDGNLTYHLTHPKFHAPKEYVVWLRGDLTDKKLKKLREGIQLKEGVTQPAEVIVLARHPKRAMVKIVLHEGRNRQIRRMLGDLGLNVTRLKRIKLGSLELGPMEPAEVRHLTPEEIQELKNSYQPETKKV